VAEVKPMESEEEVMAEQPQEDGKVSNDAKIASEIESAIKSILIKYNEQEKTILELKEQVIELGKQPASKGIKQADNVSLDLSKMSKKERILFNLRNN